MIEMVGVLAVIAILAALLVPKIFAAINESRYNTCVAGVNSSKTAAMGYFGKHQVFPAASATFAATLLDEGYLERPLTTKIGTAMTVETTTIALCGGGGATAPYKLNGTVDIAGSEVVEVKIAGVNGVDAQELSRRIDGETDAAGTPLTVAVGTADTVGRVVFAAPDATTGLTDVYVYLAHK